MVVCQYFLKGKCIYGTKCRNQHSVPSGCLKEREICQYFLKGSCRYGDRCFKEHPIRDVRGFDQFGKESIFAGYSTKNENIFRPVSPFGNSSLNLNRPELAQNSMEGDAEKVVHLIRSKVQTWEVSKIWPLSCFGGYLTGKSCLAGLQDYSPEELRVAAYEARKTNTFMQYIAEVGRLVQERKDRKRELSRLTIHNLKHEEEKGCPLFKSDRDLVGSKTDEGAAPLLRTDTESCHFQTPRSFFSLPDTKHSILSTSTNPQIFNSTVVKAFQEEPDLSSKQHSFSQSGVTKNPFLKSSGIPPLQSASYPNCSSVGNQISIKQDFPSLGKQGDQKTMQRYEILSSRTSAPQGELRLNPFATPQGLGIDGHTPQDFGFSLKANYPVLNTEPALSDKDIRAFKAEHFLLGQIPEVPPPPQLY